MATSLVFEPFTQEVVLVHQGTVLGCRWVGARKPRIDPEGFIREYLDVFEQAFAVREFLGQLNRQGVGFRDDYFRNRGSLLAKARWENNREAVKRAEKVSRDFDSRVSALLQLL